ncbi:MAG: HD domain-containing protein [Nanoarchaeota archaeon]|nr:HD domain-containing protein [Nanoarchaeota archaeon]
MITLLESKADQFAEEKHRGVFRTTGEPYITHPRAVRDLLKIELDIHDDDTLSATMLHDTIEDCKGVTRQILEQEFNWNIARIVATLSRNYPIQLSRQDYNERILASDTPVQIIKLADIIHNLSTTVIIPEKKKWIQRKIEEYQTFYVPLAQRTAPRFYDLLTSSMQKVSEQL